MAGSVCFLVASVLAFAELSHGTLAIAPRSVSWWIAVINLAGSVAFQLSALASYVSPSPTALDHHHVANVDTAIGALCFLAGAYLLIPELFDHE